MDWMNDKLYFSFGDSGSQEVNPNHLAMYDISTEEYNDITTQSIASIYYNIAVDPVGQ